MSPAFQTALLLAVSNSFMTYAWYGHLRDFANKPWYLVALIAWGVAFFEYQFQVPANRIWWIGKTSGLFSTAAKDHSDNQAPKRLLGPFRAPSGGTVSE